MSDLPGRVPETDVRWDNKWDFNDDAMRLKAHEAGYDDYFRGYSDGRKEANWALPLSVAAVAIALICAATTVIIIGRPDVTRRPADTSATGASIDGARSYMILDKIPAFCDGGRFMISQQQSGRLLLVCERPDAATIIALDDDVRNTSITGVEFDGGGALARLANQSR